MKKVIAILVCMVMAASLFTGCSTKDTSTAVETATATVAAAAGGAVAPKSGSKFTIGLSMIDMVIPFYVTIQARVAEICKDKGYELITLNAQGDSNKQIADMEDLVTQKCDVILCNSFDTKILTETINRLKDEGTPVIAIDNALDAEAKVLTCVQANNYGNGFAVGQWIAKQMKGTPIKIALLSGEMGTINSLDRRDGLLNGIIEEQLASEGTANVQIIAQGYCKGWAEDAAVTAMEDIISLNEDFNVLMSEADVMTMAAMKVLDEKGMLDGKLIASAADGQKEAFEMIKAGKYGATGLNSPKLIGDLAMDVATRYFAGETDFPSKTYTTAACVTIDNVDQYYDPNSSF
ncbi:MAG: substrate-binding domain-containing protein [Eubacteriales bacterium]